ncbi:MAG: ferrous iron transport protein B [Anaerolineae bacterium]|nr:ferrous iron transport protein B [Anaerolineae bacterium]
MCAASCHTVAPETTPTTGAGNAENTAPIILVGNPNVGKSVIFGRLTGRYVVVSNYPGTTVEVARGTLPDGAPILDTPGTNTLSGHSDDERVARDVLLAHRDTARAVVQVADAKNLRRALLLTLQLADLGVRAVLVLNMLDEAEAHGLHIDADLLSERLGIEVVSMVATRGDGFERLLAAIDRARPITARPHYDSPVEAALARIERLLPPDTHDPRGAAVRLLGGDPALAARLHLNGALTAVQADTAAIYGRPARTVLIGQQMAAAAALLEGVISEPPHAAPTLAARLSRWLTHPILGWPVLLAVLFVVYKFVGEFGAGTLVDFMEGTLFGEIVNPLATRLIDMALPVPFIHDVLVGPYGVISMALTYGLALVLPIVATFFIAFSLLEDSGYLPRLAVMLNRAFKLMGLNGKAVLPMVLGLGCDTMATMTTRILETRKERILTTLLLALGVPCSAQLGVILGMLGALSPAGVLIWLGVVVGTMLVVGLIAARLVPGERGDFVLELPPLRLPRPGNILIKTLARLEWYLKEVLPLFVVGTLILFALDRTGALAVVEKAAAPLVSGFLGLPEAAAGAFLIGFLRRDYGAAGLFAMALAGQMTAQQVVVSLIVITLFIPCIANVLMIVKEYGAKVALGVALTVFPLAFLVGGLVNAALNVLKIVV